MKKRVNHNVSLCLLLCGFIYLELTTSSLADTSASPLNESKPVTSFESLKNDSRPESSKAKPEEHKKSPNVEGELPVLKSTKLTKAGSEKRATASREEFIRSRKTVPESPSNKPRAEYETSFSHSAGHPIETKKSAKPSENTGKPQKTIKSKKSLTAKVVYMTQGLEDSTSILKDSTPPGIDFGELNAEDYSITYVSLNGEDDDDSLTHEDSDFPSGEEIDYSVDEESDYSFDEDDEKKKLRKQRKQASLTGTRMNEMKQTRVGEDQSRATKLGYGQRLNRRHFGRNAGGMGPSRKRFPPRGNAEKNTKIYEWPNVKIAA